MHDYRAVVHENPRPLIAALNGERMLSACLGHLLLDFIDDRIDLAVVESGRNHEEVTYIGKLGEVEHDDVLGLLIEGCLGGGAGILVFARPLLYLIERFPMPMMYFFLGAVAGGVPLIFSQAEIKKVSWKVIVYILVGIFAVCLIGLIPEGSFQSDMEAGMVSYLMLVLAGIFAAAG